MGFMLSMAMVAVYLGTELANRPSEITVIHFLSKIAVTDLNEVGTEGVLEQLALSVWM